MNAGVRQHGMSYSRFISGLQMKEDQEEEDQEDGSDGEGQRIVLNRKVLADLAANEPFSFKAVVDVVKMKANDGK